MRNILDFVAVVLCLMFTTNISAQNDSLLYESSSRIDTTAHGEIRLNIDGMGFFRDNEYKGNLVKGYTLPGFWLQPTISYQPLKKLKLEAGIYMLHYWGANKYPNMNYKDIATWKGQQTQEGFHILPFFRVQLTAARNVDIVIGNIYGKSNHHLIVPLYNPETSLSTDPEAGLQILWRNKFMDFDTWINWESFIFNNDKHQEAFTYGLSTRFKANNPNSATHVYFPVQLIMQHRGGEINPEAESREVKTWTNAAAGIGTTIHTRNSILTSINIEAAALYYKQMSGGMLPLEKGYGFYTKADFNLWRFCLHAAYWRAHNFITVFGNPLYGSISMFKDNYIVPNPQMISTRISYSRDLGHGFSWGAYADVFDNLPTNAKTAENGLYRESNKISVSAGICLRINPSYLLKKITLGNKL